MYMYSLPNRSVFLHRSVLHKEQLLLLYKDNFQYTLLTLPTSPIAPAKYRQQESASYVL